MVSKKIQIALVLPLILMSSCAPALIAGSIGGAILAVPATSWLMDPPKDNHLITAIYKSTSLDDAVVHAWNRVRLYENPAESSKGLSRVLAVSRKLSIWPGAEVQDMIENGKDVIELTVQREFNPSDIYQVTITLHARTLKNPENWLIAPKPPMVLVKKAKPVIKPVIQPVIKPVKKTVKKIPVVHVTPNTPPIDHWIGGPTSNADSKDTPPVVDHWIGGPTSNSDTANTPPVVDHWIGGPN